MSDEFKLIDYASALIPEINKIEDLFTPEEMKDALDKMFNDYEMRKQKAAEMLERSNPVLLSMMNKVDEDMDSFRDNGYFPEDIKRD